MKRKWWIIIVIVILVGAGYLGYMRFLKKDNSQSGIATTTKTAIVKRGTLQASVDASGSIVPQSEISLSFSSGGTVEEVLVNEGDSVKAGQPLARLDTTNLALQVRRSEAALASAQAQLSKLKAPPTQSELTAAEVTYQNALAQLQKLKEQPSAEQIVIAKANLEKAKISLQQAQSSYDRVAFRPNISMLPQSTNLQRATLDYQIAEANYKTSTQGPSAQDLEIAENNVKNAKAKLEQLQAGPTEQELTISQASVKQAESNLEGARWQLSEATLTAPMDGVVTAIAILPGQLVGSGHAVMTVSDLSTLNVETLLDETEVAQVQTGQKAIVTLNAFPDTPIPGEVEKIALTAHVQSGVVLYPVTIKLDPTNLLVRPGMTADVSIVTASKTDVLIVPLIAIHTFNGHSFVLRKLAPGEQPPAVAANRRRSNGQTQTPRAAGNNSSGQTKASSPRILPEGFMPVQVRVGATTDTEAEVSGNLKEGDIISMASISLPSQNDNGQRSPSIFRMFGGGRKP